MKSPDAKIYFEEIYEVADTADLTNSGYSFYRMNDSEED